LVGLHPTICPLLTPSDPARGENKTFLGGEETLKQRAIEVVVLQNAKCEELMRKFINQKPQDWSVVPRLPINCSQIDLTSAGMKISAKNRFRRQLHIRNHMFQSTSSYANVIASPQHNYEDVYL